MKLFNKARFKMVEGKQVKKYILYAVGEIILVVIGILIALAINKRAETLKVEDNTVKIALQVKQKLNEDIDAIKETRADIAEDLKLYNLYLKKDKSTEESFKVLVQAPFLVTVSVQFAPINPILSSALENTSLNNTDLSNKLLEIEQDYKLMDRTLRPMERIITEELITNMRYIKDNFDWYEKLVTQNSKFTLEEFSYFGSQDYKNRVVHMKFLYLNTYDETLEESLEVLTQRLNELEALL